MSEATIVGQVIIGSWVVFLAVWLFAAFTNKRPRERESAAFGIAYSLPIWVGALFLFAPFDTKIYPLDIEIIPHTALLGWIAAAIVVLGVLLAFWARFTLGRNWSGTVQVKEGHELVTKGPYAYVRHPIYSALLLMVLGTAIAVANIGAILAIPLMKIGFVIKLLAEEKLMRREFPDQYPAYAARVKRLIPFVW